MKRLELPLLEHEYWWGGRVSDGQLMPYRLDRAFSVDLSHNLMDNQACPLLLSSKGRYIWSERSFSFQVEHGVLTVVSNGDELILSEGHDNLRGAFRHASSAYFPADGELPDELLFTAPQYNLWIELIYHPTQDKVLEYAEAVLANGMAPGVIMIDDNWHEPYGTWEFHPGRFPDPKAMVDRLHEMGFKVMLWLCPFVSPDSHTFREIEPLGYLLKDAEGQTAVRRWWNGCSAILDCTNEQAVEWLHARLHHLQTAYGIDGFKFDAGDLTYYRSDDQAAIPMDPNGHCEAWGKVGLSYKLNEYRACWKLAGRPLVQRLRDKGHSWEGNGLAALIPDALAGGMLGYAFICPDMIGGGSFTDFLGDLTHLDQELIVRSAQCSALFPMMQFSVAPWRVLDQEHLQYCIDAAKLHARFGAYILELAKQAARDGEPILRHMAYVYPNEQLEEVYDQFMLGDDLLVAPVLKKGQRSRMVVFPAGTWEDDQGARIQGPTVEEVEAPLHKLPWYRKVN
ncbi:glycoside hydrolase family 31 protein [Paenibacillus sp. 1001270B_150601_E10]|uniref:glycoside hydrolase family 31 protein n=1 Tax=Paenibacillus sp. 1001270B_150601_E10 TaxID=2787079 RepID=UPI00189DED07|nr:glycoside hydrolase family 31 protein [Paenibacillus sp. 1001270B_150601_E10]